MARLLVTLPGAATEQHPLFDERNAFELWRLERRLLEKIGNQTHVLVLNQTGIGEAERKCEMKRGSQSLQVEVLQSSSTVRPWWSAMFLRMPREGSGIDGMMMRNDLVVFESLFAGSLRNPGPQCSDQSRPVNIAGQLYCARTSSRTKMSRISRGASMVQAIDGVFHHRAQLFEREDARYGALNRSQCAPCSRESDGEDANSMTLQGAIGCAEEISFGICTTLMSRWARRRAAA